LWLEAKANRSKTLGIADRRVLEIEKQAFRPQNADFARTTGIMAGNILAPRQYQSRDKANSMTEQTVKLDANKILTTVSRQILYNCILSGMTIKDGAEKAKLNYIYARKLATKGHINALALQTKAEISAKTAISIESEQISLLRIAEKAEAEGKHSAAVQAHAHLLKSIGGFIENRPNPEVLKGKELDTQRIADMRAIADMYYSKRYLASEQPTVLDLRPLAGPGGDDNGQETTQTQEIDNGTNSSGTGEEVS
jgi:hypothetical protein